MVLYYPVKHKTPEIATPGKPVPENKTKLEFTEARDSA